MILTLPWPQRILSPNARAHYMAVGKAKKALRAEWAWQANAQGAGEIAAKSLTVALEFHKPSRRELAEATSLDGQSWRVRPLEKGWRA